MTNFEWLLDEYKDDVKAAMISKAANPNMADGLAISNINDEPCLCSEIDCEDCKFYREGTSCFDRVRKWMDEEHVDEIKIYNHDGLRDAFIDFLNETNNESYLDSEQFMNMIDQFFNRIRIKGEDE